MSRETKEKGLKPGGKKTGRACLEHARPLFLSRHYQCYLCAGAAGAGAGAGAGAAASFLAGSGGFFSGADGQPTNVNVTATTKRIDKMIANSFLIDFYLLCEKVSDVGKSTRSLMLGRYSIYFYLVKINLLFFKDRFRAV